MGKPVGKFQLCLLLCYVTLGKFLDGFGPSYLHFYMTIKIPVTYRLMKTKEDNAHKVLSMILKHIESI